MVKNTVFLLFAVFVLGVANAQSLPNDVPTRVTQAFDERFRNADHVLWKRLEAHCFEVAFQIGKVLYSATYQETGLWIEMDTQIKKGYLPKQVRTSILRQFPGYTIDLVEKVDFIDRETAYKIHLKKELAVKIVQFSPDGQIIALPPPNP